MSVQSISGISSKERIFNTALDLFYEGCYDAVSVRDICNKADVTINMVSYYYGGKEELYNKILDSLSENAFLQPIQTLQQKPKNRNELSKMLELFAHQTLDALISERKVYTLIRRERKVTKIMRQFHESLVDFFEEAKKDGLVKYQGESVMIAGMFVGRLTSQVMDADWIMKATGDSVVSNKDYRDRWIKANLDVFLNGVAS